MPRIERRAEIVWEGNVARGQGTIEPGSGAFALQPFTLATRIGNPEGKTSPEELLAGAHGACFAMSLAGELAQAGTPPGRLRVSCQIVMDELEGQGHQIVGSNVRVEADVAGADDAAIDEAIAKADEGCPFSAMLKRSGAEVRISR